MGNRTSVTAAGMAAGMGFMPVDGFPTAVNYEQASNRATSVTTNAQFNPANPNFEYDPAGNQTRVIQSNGTAQRYYYDAAGRLSQVKADDGATVIASYGYGASNQRLKQTEGSTTICYAWAGSSIIGEYLDNGSTLTWQKCYVYLGGRLLATQVPGALPSATQFHHPDRLGTRVISNGGDAAYTENAVLPYGTAIDAESSGTTTNRRFTSYDRSNATKLDYAVNRFYDCKQGRFTQVDPIGMSAVSLGDPQSLNLYAYVGNDPINSTDPEGLFSWKKFFKLMAFGLFAVKPVRDAVLKVLGNKWVQLAIGIVLAIIYPPSAAIIFNIAAGSSAAAALSTLSMVLAGLQGVGAVSNLVQSKKANEETNAEKCAKIKFATIFLVGSYLERSGLNKFIANRTLTPNGRGQILQFTNPRAAHDFARNSPSFRGGGAGTGALHKGELEEIFGKLGKGAFIADFRGATTGNPGALGPLSLQVTFKIDNTLNSYGGGGFADVDKYNILEKKGKVGHAGEVIGGVFRSEPCLN